MKIWIGLNWPRVRLYGRLSFLPCRIRTLMPEHNALSIPALLAPYVDSHLFATWLAARCSEASNSSMNTSLRRLRPLEVKGFDICTALGCAFPVHCPLIDNTNQWSCSKWDMSHSSLATTEKKLVLIKMQRDSIFLLFVIALKMP
jgi:hypothetical protein